MRSEKLGYNAPIVVYDNKYYTYDEDEYRITNTPLNEQDLRVMSEAVEVLRQFKSFSYFSNMTEIRFKSGNAARSGNVYGVNVKIYFSIKIIYEIFEHYEISQYLCSVIIKTIN